MTVEEWKRKNPPIQRKIFTNGDKIRAMTDKELVEALHNTGSNWYSEEYWLNWLKQEVITIPSHKQLSNYDGLKAKYIVFKASNGMLVDNCFVLRPEKDNAAVAALATYADTTENQILAADIRKWLSTIITTEEA